MLVAALEAAGCAVNVGDLPIAGVAVFDDDVAWYGSLPLLAAAKPDTCSLRLVGAEATADLAAAAFDAA